MSSPSKRGKEAEENISKLKAKLRELFQLDRGDLDFGLYRVMALKSAEVGSFLDEHLLPQVTEALGKIADADSKAAQADLDKALEKIKELRGGVDPEKTDAVKNARIRLAAAKRDEQIEAHTYNHLCTFFSRYYDQGDFMSLRRYKSAGREAYSIPYNGEEVKLHWANADQYYVKTTENYASYIFTVNKDGKECRVRFEIAAADNEKDNVKEIPGNSRRFILAKNFATERADSLVVRFDHRPLTKTEKTKYPENGIKQQASINADTEKRISKGIELGWLQALAVPCPEKTNGDRTLLGKHITAYTSKNSFDYFIHKDLGGFLRRELDYYLKNEVISIDNLELADDPAAFMRNLAQVKAVKNIGNKIIDFLAQLESFQKQLWLKKKFVLETQYCVTLDKVPQSLYPEIAKNKAQREEWVKLLAIDEIRGDLGNGNVGYTKPLGAEFLCANPYLMLDTRHFSHGFKDKLLASLSETGPIEEQMNGLLVHGENFQALNLLQERYQEQVECVHIDPPYNTATSGFLYKNNYRHSSWLSMMENRVVSGIALLANDGSFLCHIDENEYERLHYLFEYLGIPDAGTVVWDKRNPMTGGRGVATQHEYVVWRSATQEAVYFRNRNIQMMLGKVKELSERHGGITEAVRKEYARWIGDNPDLSGGEKACRHIDDEGRIYRGVSLRAPEPRTDRKFFQPLMHPVTGKPCVVPPNGFSRTPETLRAMIERGEIIFGQDETTQPRQKRCLTSESKRPVSSVIQDARRGKANLDALGLENFPYCHPVSFYMELIGAATGEPRDIVLDYFAGSGTTGHAVINLNREDGGDRKYALVEVGHHFEIVLLPRMKKVTYSKEWKAGKPVDRNGISQLFKYIRIESYEDALDSLKVTLRVDDLVDKAKDKEFFEDYQLRYALGEETAESASLAGKDFIDPFNYTLSVVRDGAPRNEKVDLAETFNFLLGLRLKSRRQIGDVLAITGTDAKGENCLVLWRNLEEVDNDKLNKWFVRRRKTFGNDLERIYVNGDHTLNTLMTPKDKWEAVTTELVFRKLMFSERNNTG